MTLVIHDIQSLTALPSHHWGLLKELREILSCNKKVKSKLLVIIQSFKFLDVTNGSLRIIVSMFLGATATTEKPAFLLSGLIKKEQFFL